MEINNWHLIPIMCIIAISHYNTTPWGDKMDTITEQLLKIESDAQLAINAMSKENATLLFKADESLARKIARIEQECTEIVKSITREADEDAAAKITRLNNDYSYQVKMLDRNFENTKNELRAGVLHEVLHGTS